MARVQRDIKFDSNIIFSIKTPENYVGTPSRAFGKSVFGRINHQNTFNKRFYRVTIPDWSFVIRNSFFDQMINDINHNNNLISI